MTIEEKEHELMRRELWVKIAVAVANCNSASSKESPANWADVALQEFDKRFKQLTPTEPNDLKE